MKEKISTSERGAKNIFKLVKKIKKESTNVENYHTGLIGEHLIVASYQTMEIDKLEKMRFIINKIIKKKKEYKRANRSQLEHETPAKSWG